MSSIRPAEVPGLLARRAIEQFLLWSMRTWVQAFDDRPWKAAEMREAFAAVEAGEAGDHLDHGMTLLAAGAVGVIEVNCPRCRNVTEDEHDLVLVLAALQRGDEAMAGGLLAAWLPPAALRLCLPTMRRAALALEEAGYPVPMRERAVRPPTVRAGDGLPQLDRSRLH
jgi:hypothetical protein